MLETKTITLMKDGKEINLSLRYSLRALMFWEQMMSKAFDIQTLTDTYVLFYCFLLASNKPFDISFEQFMDMLDENHNAVREFNTWFREQTELQAQTSNPEKPKKGAKNKKG